MTLSQHSSLTTFTDYLRFEKRYSQHTVLAYTNDLLTFCQFAEKEFALGQPSEISSVIVRTWLASLKESGLGARSIKRKISTLKSYCRFLLKSGLIPYNPLGSITSPKTSKRLPQYVEEGDLATLFRQVEFPEGWKGRTDRLLLVLFYATGMRLAELVNLEEGQVDFAKAQLRILGKGNKERILPISAELIVLLKEYITKKGEWPLADRHSLLVNEKGKKLYPKYVYLRVKHYLSLVTTIEKKSPHILRHSFATHLSNNGAELNAIKELLGHSSLAATQVYTHNNIEKLKSVFKKSHPRA